MIRVHLASQTEKGHVDVSEDHLRAHNLGITAMTDLVRGKIYNELLRLYAADAKLPEAPTCLNFTVEAALLETLGRPLTQGLWKIAENTLDALAKVEYARYAAYHLTRAQVTFQTEAVPA